MFTHATTAPKFLHLKDTIVSVDNVQDVSYDGEREITFKHHGGGVTKVTFSSSLAACEDWNLVLHTFGFEMEG